MTMIAEPEAKSEQTLAELVPDSVRSPFAALAQAELERAQSLVDRGFISKADVQRRIATRDAAAARLRVAQATAAEQRARNARLDVRAEIGTESTAGDEVAVVDQDPEAFQRLGPEFAGRQVAGVGFDRDTLLQAGIEDAYALGEGPGAFQRLWTPHRVAYITGGGRPADADACVFCDAPSKSDEDGLIVFRGELAYVILNLFPYNPGHLMVVPYRHVAMYTDATPEEVAEIGALTQQAMRVLGVGGVDRTGRRPRHDRKVPEDAVEVHLVRGDQQMRQRVQAEVGVDILGDEGVDRVLGGGHQK